MRPLNKGRTQRVASFRERLSNKKASAKGDAPYGEWRMVIMDAKASRRYPKVEQDTSRTLEL